MIRVRGGRVCLDLMLSTPDGKRRQMLFDGFLFAAARAPAKQERP
jgi:hypothetical protein